MKVAFELSGRDLVRWVLGALLVWAAISKLANVQEFYGDILGYDLPLPSVALKAAAMVLPWLELLCGLMLLARFRVDAALVCATALFLAFVFATGQAWARGLNISCGCFDLGMLGIDKDGGLAKTVQSTWFAFFRALLLTAGTVFVWRGPLEQSKPAAVR